MHSDPHPTMIAPRRRRTLAPWLFCTLLGPLAACGGSGPEGGEERPVTVDGASQVAASATAPTASGGVNAAEHRQAPYVVLVSFDGFRWDYLDRYPTPAFRRVARNGVRAERLIPTFPTKTFPTHYSVATGMYADQHGLVGNRFWDPERQEGYSMYDRDQVEDGGLALDDEGVAGVGAAGVAHHDLGAFGQEVDDLTLALVAPLRPDDDEGAHASATLP